MFRWLFGWGATEQAQLAGFKKEPGRPAQRWEADGQGGYVKKNLSSTGMALAGLPSALSDDPFPDDDAGLPSVTANDALSAYEQTLNHRAKELQVLLERWKQKKIEVISGDVGLMQYSQQSALAHPGKTLLPTIKQFFASLFTAIKCDFESADAELHELLENAHGQVQEFCDHLDQACTALNNDQAPENERRKLSIDMCNMSIEIINELIVLTQNIQSELSYCLRCEHISEQIARHLVQMAVLVVVKVPVPELDLNFNEAYRHFLYNEIKGEKEAIDLFETDIRGQLAYAMKMINDHAIHVATSPKTSQSGLFSNAESQPDESAQLKDEPALGIKPV